MWAMMCFKSNLGWVECKIPSNPTKSEKIMNLFQMPRERWLRPGTDDASVFFINQLHFLIFNNLNNFSAFFINPTVLFYHFDNLVVNFLSTYAL